MKKHVLLFSVFSFFSNFKVHGIKLFVCVFALIILCSTALQAQIFFDGSPGTAAPPATLGGYTMVPFGDDVRATYTNYSDVPLPAPYPGVLGFSPALNHRKIGSGWATWSHGYTGSVYYTNGGSAMTFILPPQTVAFYFYAQPDAFAIIEITAVGEIGAKSSVSSGPIPVDGAGGAKYFGFYTDGIANIAQINVTAASSADFAVGEFGIFLCGEITTDAPEDEVISSCDFPTQALIDARFASWLTLFEYEGGCDPTEVFVGTPKAPLLCEGGVETVTYVVTDPMGTVTEVSTFTVNIPEPVAVAGPADETVDACDFADQAELDDAFAIWLDQFEIIEAGCGVETPTLTMYTAPALCVGGTVTVVYSVSDICTEETITRTFTVTPPPDLVLSKPADETYSSCDFTEQSAVNALFSSFLTKFQPSGGCQPIPLDNINTGNPQAPDWQCGGVEVVYYTVSDAKGCNLTTVSATFTVTPPPPVVINTPDPKDYLATSCDIFNMYYVLNGPGKGMPDPVQQEFNKWTATFSAEGSCETPTLVWEPEVPGFDMCGGSVVVTFTATDDRCYTEVITATFTITADDPIEFVQVDKDFSDDACNYANQDDVDVAFDTWLNDIDIVGGCSPTITFDEYHAPDLCKGGTVTVTWTAWDLNECVETVSLTATFTIIPPAPLTFTEPEDIIIDACTLDELIVGVVSKNTPTVESVFDAWMAGALSDISGGCSPTITHDWDGETYLERCTGGSVTVTWTIDDLCEFYIVSATFTLIAPPLVDITTPVSTVSNTCEFDSQDEVETAFASWLEGFTVSGGCDPQDDYGSPTAPALSGGSVVVYYDVLDVCVDMTVSATFTITPPTQLSGNISYYNYFGADKPMPGTLVELLDEADAVIAFTMTDVNGDYEFDFSNPSLNLLLDTEKIRVSTDVPFGGLSATDALAVWLIANGDPVSYWTPETFLNNVGNVDGDLIGIVPGINILDVTRIMDRLLYPLDPDFFFEDAAENVRNWTFYAPDLDTNFDYAAEDAGTIAYDPTYCELDILVRPFGDVLGNYGFTTPLKSDDLLQSNGLIRVTPGNQFDLPVQLEKAMEFSAMTLVLDYNMDKLEVFEVQSEFPGMRYAIEDGTIRIAWASLDPIFVEEGQQLVRLVARTLDQVSHTDHLLALNGQTSFGDRYAIPIDDYTLSASSVDNTGSVVGITTPDGSSVSLTAYPNPFRNELTLKYELTETSSVRISIINMLGAEVARVVDVSQEAGAFTHTFIPDNMDYGVYFVRFDVKGETTESSQLIKLVYIR